MKEFGETLSWIMIILFSMAIYFVFDGSPDLWDKLHERVMQSATCLERGE